MSKTRRQRALEHPDLPKPGVRDWRRVKNPAAVELGRLGGSAPHVSRGLQSAPEAEVKRVSALGVEARRRKREQVKETV